MLTNDIDFGTSVAGAHRGWPTMLLPVIYLVVVVAVGMILRAVVMGAEIVLEALLGL